MMQRFYPESDGGDCWIGHAWSRQPKTYYVVDQATLDRAAECKSWADAKATAERMNKETRR